MLSDLAVAVGDVNTLLSGSLGDANGDPSPLDSLTSGVVGNLVRCEDGSTV